MNAPLSLKHREDGSTFQSKPMSIPKMPRAVVPSLKSREAATACPSRPVALPARPSRQSTLYEYKLQQKRRYSPYPPRESSNRQKASVAPPRETNQKQILPGSTSQYRLPIGVERASETEVINLFNQPVERFARPLPSIQICPSCKKDAYYDVDFRRHMDKVVFARLAARVPELKPYEHLEKLPDDILDAMEHAGCILAILPNRSPGPTVEGYTWCRHHNRLEHFQLTFQYAAHMSVFRHKGKEYWDLLVGGHDLSHICHIVSCGNPFHSLPEHVGTNRSRQGCQRFMRTSLNQGSVSGDMAIKLIHSRCRHEPKCFIIGINPQPTREEVLSHMKQDFRCAIENVGICHEHKKDFPVHIAQVFPKSRDYCLVHYTKDGMTDGPRRPSRRGKKAPVVEDELRMMLWVYVWFAAYCNHYYRDDLGFKSKPNWGGLVKVQSPWFSGIAQAKAASMDNIIREGRDVPKQKQRGFKGFIDPGCMIPFDSFAGWRDHLFPLLDDAD